MSCVRGLSPGRPKSARGPAGAGHSCAGRARLGNSWPRRSERAAAVRSPREPACAGPSAGATRLAGSTRLAGWVSAVSVKRLIRLWADLAPRSAGGAVGPRLAAIEGAGAEGARVGAAGASAAGAGPAGARPAEAAWRRGRRRPAPRPPSRSSPLGPGDSANPRGSAGSTLRPDVRDQRLPAGRSADSAAWSAEGRSAAGRSAGAGERGAVSAGRRDSCAGPASPRYLIQS